MIEHRTDMVSAFTPLIGASLLHVAAEYGSTRAARALTTLFDVTPISYARFGLLPQVHRRDRDIYDNIGRLLAAAARPVPPLANVPNRYLQQP